jgi:hypothetical protein
MILLSFLGFANLFVLTIWIIKFHPLREECREIQALTIRAIARCEIMEQHVSYKLVELHSNFKQELDHLVNEIKNVKEEKIKEKKKPGRKKKVK